MLLVVSPNSLQGAVSAVPEPTAWVLFVLGIALVLWTLRSRQEITMLNNEEKNSWFWFMVIYAACVIGYFALGCASTQTNQPPNVMEQEYDPNWKPDSSDGLDYFFDTIGGASDVARILIFF